MNLHDSVKDEEFDGEVSSILVVVDPQVPVTR
jgi:hypothetical protein